MADAIIGPLVGRLQELALSEARALVAVNDDIRRLRDKLMFLQAFLREADAKRHAFSDEITRVWLQQTRDAVFDAEDAVDHYYLQVDMSRYPPWARPCMRHVAIFTTQVRMRRSLSRKVKNINSRLEDILHNKDRYKMEDVNKKTDLTWKASTTISYTHKKLDYLHQPHHVIHVEEGKRLREVLTATEQELQNQGHRPVVITVYGKSGVGKTTLVRDKYEEMAKKKFFDVQAMESFAPYLTAINILQQIVQQLTEDNKNCPRRMVYKRLDEELKDKKYFLVIDGEVSSTDWKNILTSLPVGAQGSRIVHITQHKPEEPPSNCHHVIHLQSLEQDNTIQLFRKRLLHSEVQDEKLQRQYPHIHEITEGLPLAVVLLSGLVQTKEFPGEWDKVFDYLSSKQSKRLDSILSVCFDDLPHELKCCFLYFAALPSNITIEARSLVCMWMAEGFLRPRHGKTMEKVGYIYLNELIERNLVKSVDMDDVSSVGCEFVTIQNKVHDFLQFEAHEASFVEVHSEDDIPTLTSARRLSLQNYTDKYAALASSLPKLRSIISHFEQDPKVEDPIEHHTYPCCSPKYMAILKKKKDIKSHVRGLLHGSEFLRVINLRGIEIGEELPDEIGNVVHLQYLGITSCSLKKIPKSIGRLTSLQTLDVRETNVRELPLDFWTIKTLRHVFGFVLKLPKEMGGLKHLQTLDSIDLDACDQDLPRMLENMIHVEHLSVWFTGNKEAVRFAGGKEKEFSASFSKLEHLRTLILHGGIIPSCVFTSHSLRRLKFMVLQGELPSQLKDMASCFPNLIILSLQETNVSQELISELANLPSLVTLVLSSCSHKDEEAQLVFSSAGFRYLKKLKIDVKVLMRVEMKVGALPKLEELDVYSHHTSCQHVIEMATFDRKKRSVLVNLLKKENVVLMI